MNRRIIRRNKIEKKKGSNDGTTHVMLCVCMMADDMHNVKILQCSRLHMCGMGMDDRIEHRASSKLELCGGL